MPYEIYPLPTFPVMMDMWEELKNEKRPIVVYGMGNGADKLFDRLDSFGVEIREVFASDGFVRGHSFRGYKVRSLSEIKQMYPVFVVLLSFASNREEVIEMLSRIDGECDMYVPDMPVAGVDEYFDKDFYNIHYNEIIAAYECLEDDHSRAIFSSVINYKLSGRMKYLMSCYSTRDELYSIMPCDHIKTVVDAGAYNGDTAKEAKIYFSRLEKLYAIEPDKRNFKKLLKYSEAECDVNIMPINAAAWSDDSIGAFFGSGNRNSTALATASFEHSEDEVKMIEIDSIADEKIDYIKYDVEGAEREALTGSHEVILRDRPTLLISLYHRSRDIFELINIVKEKYPDYKLYLRRLKCLPAWEIDLIAVK